MSKSSCRPWIALLVALTIFAGLLVSDHAPAKAAPRVRSAKKISAEVQKKVSAGQGNERIRVIVQPREAWNSDIDSALEGADVTNIRQFQKFNFRVLTVSASAAAAKFHPRRARQRHVDVECSRTAMCFLRNRGQ